MKSSSAWASAACLAFALTACGGGNSGQPASVPLPSTSIAPGSADATVVIKIPAKASSASKRRHYITSSVQGVSFTVTNTAGANLFTFYALTPQATYCASGPSGLTCTLDIVAPPGSDTFVVDLYDSTEPGAAYVVSTATMTQTIAAQTSNTINIITDAVPTFVTLGIANPYPTSGAPASIPLALDISDPDGNIIVGSFAGPLDVNTTDTSGTVTFSKTVLNQASDATGLTLNYNGNPIGVTYASVTDSIAGESLSSGLMPFQPGFAGPVSSSALLYFASPSAASQTITLTAVNGAAGPFTLSANATYSPVCTGYAAVTGTGPTFTIAPTAATFSTTPAASIGMCWLTGMTLSNDSLLPIAVMISP